MSPLALKSCISPSFGESPTGATTAAVDISQYPTILDIETCSLTVAGKSLSAAGTLISHKTTKFSLSILS